MSHEFTIAGPVALRDRPAVFEHVKSVFAALQGEGIVPRDRAPIDAGELVLFIDCGDVLSPPAFVVFYECEANTLWVDLVHTQPSWRRKRMALKLLQRLGTLAAEQGMRRIMLGTGLTNEAMRKLGQCAGYFSDHIVMARPIAALSDAVA